MLETIDASLSVLTLAGQAVILLLIVSLVVFRGGSESNFFLRFLTRHALLLAFIVALVSTSGSLFYSDILGYEPCRLCWFQRIFMYPQVLMLGLALNGGEVRQLFYGGVLAAVGGIIAAYHYLLQVGAAPNISCEVVGYSAGCSGQFVMDFGYITIPMMAATAFALIVIASILGIRQAN